MSFPSSKTVLESSENRSATNAPALWLEDNDVSKGAKITAYLVIFLACLLGNSLLIAVVYKNANRRMRTPSNYFIVNMAFADMFLVAYMVPQNIANIANGNHWLITGVAGELFCRLFFFISEMSVLVSSGSLFFIALDRYFLVFHPLKRMITLRIARRIIAAVWIFAIIFTAPLFIMGSLIQLRAGYLACTFNFSIIGLVISYFLFGYIPIILIPLIIIIILYIAIGFKIKRATPPGNQLPSTQERRERMTHKFRHGARVVLERLVPGCFTTANEVAAMQSSAHQMPTHSARQLDEIVPMDQSEMH
ncbi:hypothetical protein ACROYT_G021701 [Oculina patagonica]